MAGLTVGLITVGSLVPMAAALQLVAAVPLGLLAQRYRLRALVTATIAATLVTFVAAGVIAGSRRHGRGHHGRNHRNGETPWRRIPRGARSRSRRGRGLGSVLRRQSAALLTNQGPVLRSVPQHRQGHRESGGPDACTGAARPHGRRGRRRGAALVVDLHRYHGGARRAGQHGDLLVRSRGRPRSTGMAAGQRSARRTARRSAGGTAAGVAARGRLPVRGHQHRCAGRYRSHHPAGRIRRGRRSQRIR